VGIDHGANLTVDEVVLTCEDAWLLKSGNIDASGCASGIDMGIDLSGFNFKRVRNAIYGGVACGTYVAATTGNPYTTAAATAVCTGWVFYFGGPLPPFPSRKSVYKFVRPKWTVFELILALVFIYLVIDGNLGTRVALVLLFLSLVYSQAAGGMALLDEGALTLKGRLRCRINYAQIADVRILRRPSDKFAFPWERPNIEVRTKRLCWFFMAPLLLPTKSVRFEVQELDRFVEDLKSRLVLDA
jgi:hypothetical protein